MKKLLSVLLVCMLLLPCLAFAQEDQATNLPMDVTFEMDYEAIKKHLGEGVTEDEWEDGIGSIFLEDKANIVGGLTSELVTFEVNRNNSAKDSRLSQITIELPVGDNCIAAFRNAVAELTSVYGVPDSDPFDEAAVANYVEYGGLGATWTKEDVRIDLYMSRMFDEYLSVDFSKRICYDAADLEVAE